MDGSDRERRKKEQEEHFAKWFIDNVGWDSCRLIPDEAPDFGIECPDKTIGLEVVNFYKDEESKRSGIKEVESLCDKWLSKVSTEYYEISEVPIRIKVRDKSRKLSGDPMALTRESARRSALEWARKLTPELAGKLACRLTLESNIGIWKNVEFEFEAADKFDLKIFLRRLPDESERCHRWTFVDSHIDWSKEINERKIQGTIFRKAKKLRSYRKKHPETILLIVVDRTYGSGMLHVSADEMVLYNGGFLCVYLALYPDPPPESIKWVC